MIAISIQLPWWLKGFLSGPPSPQSPQQPDPFIDPEVLALRAAVETLREQMQRQEERQTADREEFTRVRDNQAELIRQADITIQGLRSNDEKRQGDLREAYTRIVALEQALREERVARTNQATEMGDLRAQLRIADERLKFQRDEITQQGKQIAVLDDARVKAEGVALVWQLRAEKAEQERDTALVRITELEQEVTTLRGAA